MRVPNIATPIDGKTEIRGKLQHSCGHCVLRVFGQDVLESKAKNRHHVSCKSASALNFLDIYRLKAPTVCKKSIFWK